MKASERKQFWGMLERSTLHELQYISDWAFDHLPRYLYRYRSINVHSLRDLEENRLSFSRANRFDDPFDSYIRINYRDFIRRTSERLNGIRVHPKKMMSGIGLPVEFLEKITQEAALEDILRSSSFRDFIIYRKQAIRKRMCIACLAETYNNENLWLKYAGSHTGFCVEYDFKVEGTIINKSIMPPLPVFYSGHPFDTTNAFVEDVLSSMAIILRTIGDKNNADRIKTGELHRNELDFYRTCLIKTYAMNMMKNGE